MKKPSQSGFAAVEALLIVVILAILGFTGWYVIHARNNTNKSLSDTAKSQPATIKKSTQKQASTQEQASTPAPSGYLVIKEWGVKVQLSNVISGATYHMVTNNKYFTGPVAFLSTASLDASSDCVDYYTKYASPDNPQPTFQGIERLVPTDNIPQDGPPAITAAEAVRKYPDYYKQVGGYIYGFTSGNGFPCKEQTPVQTQAFQATLKTIQAE